MTSIAFIGFGEAGSLIAGGLGGNGATITGAYDLLIDQEPPNETLQARANEAGVTLATSRDAAVAGADIVLSAVTCDQCVNAASAVAPYLQTGQIYLDINSTSPRAKRDAAAAVEEAGAHFVEAAVMDLVPPHGHKVPMLLAGGHARDAAERLTAYEMRVRAISETIGDAAAIKMVRSVFMKGFSAILLECLHAAHQLDAETLVLESLQGTYPQLDWQDLADKALPRLVQHARRQSNEMLDVADTLIDMGIEPITAKATAARLGWLADRNLQEMTPTAPRTAADVLRSLKDRRRHD